MEKRDLMNERLDRFEKTLEEGLLKICRMEGLADEMLASPDIDARWDAFIKDYVADAVTNFNEYPQAAIGFAGFLGMAVACLWDRDWELCRNLPYRTFYGPRGFDDMDDHIVQDVLGLGPEKASKVSSAINSCAIACLELLRHEGIETQTAYGFYALSRCYSVLYRIGEAIELTSLGYHREAVGDNC